MRKKEREKKKRIIFNLSKNESRKKKPRKKGPAVDHRRRVFK
jgi:hypothetical protein